MLALVLVALAVGLSNFAAALGIGISGVDARTRLRVGLLFGLFETGMPIVGVVIGRSLDETLGAAAHQVGAALLIATGVYGVVQALRGDGEESHARESADQPLGRLVITALALSLDNLAAGFALGAYEVGLAVAVLVIGAVSVTMSLLGLEFGARIGATAGQRGEIIGGVVLIGVGAALAAGVL